MTIAVRDRGLRNLTLLLLAASLGSLAPQCFIRVSDPGDSIVDRDPRSPETLRAAEIPPGTPWVERGPDGEFETADDVVSRVWGDTDLVVRVGLAGPVAAIPAPAPLRAGGSVPEGIAGALGGGTPIPFLVMGSDGNGSPTDRWTRKSAGSGSVWLPPVGSLFAPAYFEGLPFIVIAFGDLDADGFVGVTALDGDPFDTAIEEAELIPVGRRIAIGETWGAQGSLQIAAGGPAAAPTRVAVTAATYAGSPRPGYFGGNVPDGPAIMTRMPFLPRTEPDRVIDSGPQGPNPADPDSLAAVEIEPDFVPDFSHPVVGEAYTLLLDGSDPSIDVTSMRSGPFSRFGLALAPDPLRYRAHALRPIRTGLDAAGMPAPFEVLQQLALADDGSSSELLLRVVALDRLGNITEPPLNSVALAIATGPIRIVSPDVDGDPRRESIPIADTRGTAITIDDEGGALDDPGTAGLFLEGAGGFARIEISLTDPDVDDSGLVDDVDEALVRDLRGADLGEDEYDPLLDIDGNGRIDDDDADLVEAASGQGIAIP